MTVFLTGATGFLGLNILDSVLRRNWDVRVLVRDSAKAKRLLPSFVRITIVEGDLESFESWKEHLAGCEVLIHGAAYFRESFQRGQHDAKLHSLNVRLPEEIVRHAAAVGVRRSIVVSSSLVVSPVTGRASLEDDPAEGAHLSGYGKSKIEMEKVLRQINLPGHELVLVRPGWMWGPKDYAPTGAGQIVLDMMKVGKYQFVKAGPLAIVDVRDVAEAIVRSAEVESPSAIYNLSGNMVAAYKMVEEVGKNLDIKVSLVPVRMALILSGLLEFVTRITGSRNPIPREGILTLAASVDISTERSKRELGAVYRPYQETARDAAMFFKNDFAG